ncbi:MAG: FkbM family methyltransferase [Pirellula sp.]
MNRLWLNDTALYRLYLAKRYPAAFALMQAERSFYAELLGRKVNLIFDVGANAGHKAIIFRRLAKKVICFEPDPAAARTLRRRFWSKPEICVRQIGVSSDSGILDFQRVSAGSPYNSFSKTWVENQKSIEGSIASTQGDSIPVQVQTLDQLIGVYGKPDFIKIDVEGFEIEVLKGLSQPINLISFECNLPKFKEQSIGCVHKLVSLSNSYVFNYLTSDNQWKFENDWIDDDAITRRISEGSHVFLEVFAKLDAQGKS